MGAEPRPGLLRLSFRKFVYAAVCGQCLAAQHEAEAPKDWIRMGNLPSAQKDERQPFEKSGRRSEGCLRPEGHGLGVSMEIYTSSDLDQKNEALKKLEAAVLRKPQPEELYPRKSNAA